MSNPLRNSQDPVELRDALADELMKRGMITSPSVEHAVRTVPREQFAPEGTPLDEVYAPDKVLITKRDANGAAISSISAVYIQARMIDQVEPEPGMRVLEIGSGGYNAALIAEVVGPTGRVISLDIDPEVANRASARLEATGYGRRVEVVVGDGEEGDPERAPFHRIIVTAGLWDIPPALLAQLAPGGRIVLPMRMRGVTRTIAFRRGGGHLASTSTEVAGFVPVQGAGAHPGQAIHLPDIHGDITLEFEDGLPEQSAALLDSVFSKGATEVWTGATVKHGVSFADLYLWLAWYLPGFCKVATDVEESRLGKRYKTWFPFGSCQGDSFACLAARPALDGEGVEFGARGFGEHAEQVAACLAEQIQAWDRGPRHTEPTFAYWPNDADLSQMPQDVAVLRKKHGLLTISWPRTE
ncbi:methyltransferase, FxLD system [Bailinhaonella thermotolerans]|uniref:Protein-L-isoaspartate O-methyltransferase n=1 Tax=Bailinhaonella thermotolerans TaxID=1070861 RepID=A0A3A4A5S2_9ACTN|nr:methyltransferase, FxLD system [Bailinhaonella thermotolerans]RJL23189.1 methyltransferase, FxLD system [Bailinhaonella thermotolerans]